MGGTGAAGQNTRPAAWTTDEDTKFLAILERMILEEGKTLEDVYPVVAEEVGRPEGGCKYRYTNVIRKGLTGKLKEKLVDNSPRGNAGKPANNTAQDNNRTKIIIRLQQVDKELSKVDGDILKAQKLIEDLKTKKQELGSDMQRYTDLLVKSALGTVDGQPSETA